jgi:hypothetical protein
MLRTIKQWWQRQTGEDETPLDGDTPAFVVSFVVHLIGMIVVGAIPLAMAKKPIVLTITQSPTEEEEVVELKLPEEFYFSDLPSTEIGANSTSGVAMAFSEAPLLSDVSNVPIEHELIPAETDAILELNNTVIVPTALHVNHNVVVKGAAGHGTTGAAGAIDRLTHEILLSLEERKTLVVWLFDQTASLIPQRKAIHDRFGQIYRELGIIEAAGDERFKKLEDKPLLSSVISFGDDVKLLTRKPTDNLEELRSIVANMPNDDSGNERIFKAISLAVKEYMHYRVPPSPSAEPERNVMIVAFTDEVGSDQELVEPTVKQCRRYNMPVYIVGIPAPFGRRETQMKWVDPDPKYDQTPKWGVVEQGPESLLPERLNLSFSGSKEDEAPIDSGFGPFALTRLCNETGGLYFAVHPNRNARRNVSMRETEAYSAYLQRFFDPEIMRRYKPDYVSPEEYKKRLAQNKARAALVHAATFSNITPMESPTLRFVKQDEATFGNALSAAQQAAARLEPKIAALYEALKTGEQDRHKETLPRWQAGYDLAMGRILAVRVRTESYNAMLASAKRGLAFKNPKNNTWVLEPANEISVGSQMQKLADQARTYLERVVKEHPDTPWAMLAERELKDPIGWKWTEASTPTPAMVAAAAAANPAPPPPPAIPANMPKPPPTRPLPKL